jgi:hypothetical protein
MNAASAARVRQAAKERRSKRPASAPQSSDRAQPSKCVVGAESLISLRGQRSGTFFTADRAARTRASRRPAAPRRHHARARPKRARGSFGNQGRRPPKVMVRKFTRIASAGKLKVCATMPNVSGRNRLGKSHAWYWSSHHAGVHRNCARRAHLHQRKDDALDGCNAQLAVVRRRLGERVIST